MTNLRVGIIGLGRRWRKRYRPALRALADRFTVIAVCDQMRRRAHQVAKRLGCRAAAGPTHLLESGDIDAILLLDAQWYGLWPVEAACRYGKPVYCAVPLERDQPHADGIRQKVRNSRLPVLMAMAPRVAPATARLQELMAGRLGPPRLLLCEQASPKPGPISGALLDWCALILDAIPVAARPTDVGELSEMHLDFPGGRAARVSRWPSPHVRPSIRLRAVAERGAAWIELPHRVRWNDAEGWHAENMSRQPSVWQRLLERFHQSLTSGQPMQPSLDEAQRAMRWLQGVV
jgi:hypothetical protein